MIRPAYRSGSYLVVLELPSPRPLHIARRHWELSAGHYVYAGTADGMLFPRLLRHIRRSKLRRWHIDYLTSQPDVRIPLAIALGGLPAYECDLIDLCRRLFPAARPVNGFGNTDCHRKCPAHLLFLDDPRAPEILAGSIGVF